MMRLYRLLLHLYPRSFRHEYGAEMSAVVARSLRSAGPFGRIAVWLEAIADVLSNAIRVHAELTTQDVRYAFRSFRRAPAFAITAVIVAALGVGATTAAFSITDHVMLRPLPFDKPDRLVRLYQSQPHRGYPRLELSPANYRDWQRMATGFQSMGAFTPLFGNLTAEGDPERLIGSGVTPEVLPILGIAPMIGRHFNPEEAQPDAAGVIILSYQLWQERFAGAAAVLGRKVILNDEPFMVVGIMPKGFRFPSRDTRFWIPLKFRPNDFEDRTNVFLYGIARLRDGVSVEEAGAQLQVVAAQLARQHPAENARTGATVVDLRTELSRQGRLLLIALFGAALCVLLIACTNLGNLLLARALTRRRELAVRAALGASAERLVRQLLVESLLLAFFGGVLGIVLAIVAMPLGARLVPNALPIAEVPGVDIRVLLFAAAATLATGIGFGVLPALRARRVDATALAEGPRTGSGRADRIRSTLVVAEVAASVVLLISAGLLIRALWNVQGVHPGFEAEGVLTLRTPLPVPKYLATGDRARYYDQVLSELRRIPGVSNAAFISWMPMSAFRGGIWPVTMDGRRESEVNAKTVGLRFVTPGFFQTLRIPLVAGRDVDARDTASAPFVAVVSESFLRDHFPGQSPLGRRFFVAFRERIIVGVVGNVRVRGLERPSEPQVYLPHQQVPDGALIFYMPQDLVVRSSLPPSSLVPAVRAIVARVDPRQPLSDIRLLRDVVEADMAPRTVQLRVLGAFAAVALLLAGIGLHGLLAFMVSTQSHEIGVRMALGAASHDIASMVVRHGIVLAAAGATLGVAAGYAAGKTMESLLAGISPGDPLAYGAAVGLVLAATLAGTFIPAVRAARIDPLTAIRIE